MAGLTDPASIISAMQAQAKVQDVRVTQHAQQEMVEDGILLDEVLEALSSCQLLESYPEHRRGACGLVLGYTSQGRPLHVVCTTALSPLVIITVYEPREPKWVNPTQRGRSS